MKDHPRQSGGLVLIDMIALLALLGVFLLVSGQLFVLTVRAQAQADRAMGETTRLDAAVSALRRDVWGSRALVAEGGHTLRLAAREGDVIWEVAENGVLRRESPDGVRVFADLGQAAAFEVAGPVATVRLRPVGREEVSALPMVSQVMLMEAPR